MTNSPQVYAFQRTYVGETGAWAHSGLLKLLAQFRTFSLTSVEKQWGRNVHNYGALKSVIPALLAGSAGGRADRLVPQAIDG